MLFHSNEFYNKQFTFYYSITHTQNMQYAVFFSMTVACENGNLQCPDSQACYADHAVCDYYDDCGTNYDEFGCPEEGKIKLLS